MTSAAASSPPLLQVRGLTVEYAGNRALAIDDFSLAEGELAGVVGANGAGKSTFVNALLGWSRGTPRTQGEIWLGGTSIHSLATEERARRGMLLVPENELVFASMTVEENLAHVAKQKHHEGRRIYSLDEIYSLFPNLAERRQHLGGQLSGGERQMLGIARALRLAPKLLLLDEPSIGLAPRLVATVLETIRKLADTGLSVLVVEQNVKAAIRVVDRLILLERGHIVASGSPQEMRDDPRMAKAYLGGGE
ncbi:ABC transporter ATP-binding protein [Rhizobium sp. SSA_523]|uniref:ABC transporter ATP-binding protein n=1 Tax=Rhizobium sp. SSA_523 TaxID=2952477 RepID=UPI002090B055|nr:ATP-binding cassette domain-containing protein [Rhizobium sp. SSA_523]MCO5731653.1 ATP-binding cassette domain-containing protein [Rhizobium sp. SSA_523]WKC21842.1 ATP-binding cassette domain-containing protein [Rhizobium sp. SSA_523]